jgi:Notch 3
MFCLFSERFSVFIGILVIAAVCLSSAVAHPPCVCTRQFKPVCGSDGVTYANDCLLECAAHTQKKDIKIAKAGPCESVPDNNCVCTFLLRPVCGVDGVTYSNDCMANCKKVAVAKQGECLPAKEADQPLSAVKVADLPRCTCTKEGNLVCGSDGVTYSNPCMLNCATAKDHTLSIAHYGPCEVVPNSQNPHPTTKAPEENCVCNLVLAPVCSTDGVTYGNNCLLDCASKQKLRDGACEEVVTVPY